MQYCNRTNRANHSGFIFIELIVVTSVMVIIFGALFLSFQFTLELMATTRAKLSALSLANDRMEYYRSLPYDSVGVVAGFPAGTIPQTSLLTLNGLDFNERVRVDYVDDPADDIAGVDGNGIVTDYKQIRLEYTWSIGGDTKELSLSSYIVPRAMETDVGGGTVRINVLDADSALLTGASVRLFSASTTFAYDVTNPTTAAGSALFAVPADSGYQVEVTANIAGRQYSTASTYVATTLNPNPVVGPFAVLEADVSTLTFQIGELSDFAIKAMSTLVEDSVLEVFSDISGIASSTGTTAVSGGDLQLRDSSGVYDLQGRVFLNPVTPATLAQWEVVRLVSDLPSNTNYVVQLYTGDALTAYTLIPDSDLPGNTAGFTDTLIDLSGLDPVLYPAVSVGLTLMTTDSAVTPRIGEIEVYWRESVTNRSGFTLDVRGNKIIGTDSVSAPIYKTVRSVTADAGGNATLVDLEFDAYTVTSTAGADLAAACASHPVVHRAGIDSSVALLYVPDAAYTVRVSVSDGLARSIPGVSVRLQRSGYDVMQTTNTCGQTFFTGGLTDAADYRLVVSAPGFATQTIDPFTVSNDVTSTIILIP